MGPVYSKLGKKNTFRILVVFFLIVACISLTLYSRPTTEATVVELTTTTRNPVRIDEASSSGQQDQNWKHEIITPKNDLGLAPKQQFKPNDLENNLMDHRQNGSANEVSIGKITVSFGEPDEVFDRAIRSHELHNKQMGYPQFVLREKIMSGLWSKHAFIFSVIAQELAKPEPQRLKWVMWLDRDTVLMNPLLRLEEFLPPPGFEKIYLMATNDKNGLNNGVFILRVNDWALKLFSFALAFHHYVPSVPLKYSEQSAMENVIKNPRFNNSVAIVPQHWFNSFDPPSDRDAKRYHATPGSLLIHFASNRDGLRPLRMKNWMDIVEEQTVEWSVPFNETFYPAQFKEYWRRRGEGENISQIVQELELKPR